MPSPNSSTKCFTIPQVAAELEIAKSSVYRMIRAKELRAIRVLGKLRVRAHELQRYLDLISSQAFQRTVS